MTARIIATSILINVAIWIIGTRFKQIKNDILTEAFFQNDLDNLPRSIEAIYQHAYDSFRDSGMHNILEAATFGMPIFFGNKKFKKFQEATDLIRLEAAFTVADYHGLNEQFIKLNHDVASTIAQSYVKGHIGATDKIIDYCKDILR